MENKLKSPAIFHV
jgi:hypothetical protein